jgi:hypothetical protein
LKKVPIEGTTLNTVVFFRPIEGQVVPRWQVFIGWVRFNRLLESGINQKQRDYKES